MAESGTTDAGAPAVGGSSGGSSGADTGLGLSGRIAAQFQNTEITPLLALVGLLLGLFAILITPREEEPPIHVTFADVFLPLPGSSARDVAHLIAAPAAPRAAAIRRGQ
ncbi:hypothetical protein, partial [Thiohalocapsa sp.]|uniref:hypothetical protein n=1 Tax=Thiohalocapsa sp. TaxID=2497641 RepID=UPI0025CF92E7